MEIKILVKEHQENDLHNFIDSCVNKGFALKRQGGGNLPNFSGYYAELKGERWQNADTGEGQLTIPDVSNSFLVWWQNTGSAIRPNENDDFETHAKRVCEEFVKALAK